MDIFDKVKINAGPLGKYADQAHGYFAFPKLKGDISNRMHFNGKEMLIWSLNNYLGLANHPEVRKSDADAAAEFGLALPMGARMMSGNSDYHEQLEKELSEFVQKEDTFLLNYGYQGVLSAIDALVDRHDIVIYDAESHACIVDGLRLHQGKRIVYKHNDVADLEKQLKRAEKQIDKERGGILVITEGVFGMSGNQGRLREIVSLKERYNFRLFVDDAHGFGTMGKSGAGTGEHQEIQDEIDIYFSTFAKSMASIGAFISADKKIIDNLRYNMRSQIFAKSLPMPLVVGALTRLKLLRSKPELREKLWEIVNLLQKGLRVRGFDIGNTNSPVTPVFLSGTIEEAMRLVADLRENHNVFCSMVVYPVVPKGIIILRLIPTAIHTVEDVNYTLETFTKISQKLKDKKYQSENITDIN